MKDLCRRERLQHSLAGKERKQRNNIFIVVKKRYCFKLSDSASTLSPKQISHTSKPETTFCLGPSYKFVQTVREPSKVAVLICLLESLSEELHEVIETGNTAVLAWRTSGAEITLVKKKKRSIPVRFYLSEDCVLEGPAFQVPGAWVGTVSKG